MFMSEEGRLSNRFFSRIVTLIALRFHQDEVAQQPGRPTMPFRAQISAPESEPILNIDSRHVRRIEELSQVLHLPEAPGEPVAPEPVEINEVDLALPTRDRFGPSAWDVKVAEVQILVEIAARVQRASQARHFCT